MAYSDSEVVTLYRVVNENIQVDTHIHSMGNRMMREE